VARAARDDPVTAYARAVSAGHVLTNRLVRLACARHLEDLGSGALRGLRFDGVFPAMQSATITVEEAGQALGVSRNSAYAAAQRGEVPVIKIGRRLLVPKAAFERLLAGAGEKPSGEKTA
jgi:excisionase family DNA binding protein